MQRLEADLLVIPEARMTGDFLALGHQYDFAPVTLHHDRVMRPLHRHRVIIAIKAHQRFLASVRCGIEKIFGWWKRCTGYRRVRYVGRAANRLELEFKCVCWNLKRLASLA